MTNVAQMPSKEEIAKLVRTQVEEDALIDQLTNANGDIDAFVEGDEDLKKLRTELTNELVDESAKVVSVLTDALANMHLGASMTIHNCRKRCGLDPEGTDTTEELLQMREYQQANYVIAQVNEVNRQTALQAFVASANINYDVSTNINFVERQYEQFKSAIRTYKLKGINFEPTLKLAKKHKDHPVIKSRIAVLYAVLRFFNEIRSQRKVVDNMIYITHTSALVCTVFASKFEIPLMTAIPALIIGAENSK